MPQFGTLLLLFPIKNSIKTYLTKRKSLGVNCMFSNSTTSQLSLMPLTKSTNQCNKISQIFGIYPCSNPRSNLIFLLISNHLMSSCLDNTACFSLLVEIWVSCITIAKGPLDCSFTFYT